MRQAQERERRKGKTPKEETACGVESWAYGKESYDCHPVIGWCAIGNPFGNLRRR